MIQTDSVSSTVRIFIGEEINSSRVDDLRSEINSFFTDGYIHFVLDMKDTQFMCSAALGLLVDIYNRAVERNGSIRLENLNQPIQRLLEDTKLLDLLTMPPTDTHRIEALTAIQEQMSQELIFLSFVQTITGNILRTPESSAIFGQALEAIVRFFRPRQAFLMTVEEGDESKVLRTAAIESKEPGLASRIDGLPLVENSFENEVLQTGKAVRFDREKLAHVSSPLIEGLSIKKGIIQPLLASQSALGLILLEIEADAEDFLTQNAPQLHVFSNVCGLALEKQRMLEEIRYKNEQLSQTLNDLNKTQIALSHAGKLAVASALSRGLGHALNNKLVPIMGYAQMLSMQFERDTSEGQKAAIIEDSAQKIKKVIDKMRGLVKRDITDTEIHDIREVIDACLRMLDFLFQENKIGVERHYGDVDGDMELMRESLIQGIVALFHRLPIAFAETEGKRRLIIKIERDEKHMHISFTDNGHIISREMINAVQQPFDYEGDQLAEERFNFSLARSILKDHRGALDIESSEEIGGTRVILHIPLEQKSRYGNTMMIG
ncbi:MAG: anti-sigma factor antagonist [Candidatus Sumerlaeia bacterium]